MNIEEKAKAYDEALDRCKEWASGILGHSVDDSPKDIAEFIFPQLAESEDERIRKEIIDFIQWAEDRGMIRHDYHQAKRPAVWIAYLEKQKETANSFTDGVIEVRSFQRGIAEGRRLERQKECVADSSKTSANEDESIRKFLVDYFTSYKIGNVATKLNGVRIDDILNYLEKQKELPFVKDVVLGLPGLYFYDGERMHFGGSPAMEEKQKENSKSADSISSDCTSDAKCEDRWHKVEDSLPDSTREVLCKDAIGNYFIGRYYSKGVWEVSMYDDCDKSNEDNPPVVKWCEIPSEKQKEQKPRWEINNPHTTKWTKEMIDEKFEELVEEYHKQKPVVTHGETYHVDTLGTQQVIAGKMPQKPAEWSEEDEKILKGIIGLIDHNQHYDVSNKDMLAWLKSLPERFNLQSKQEQNDYITPHKEFFKFIYDRLINVHKENPNVDYMRSFKERLNNLSFGEKQEWSEKDENKIESIKGLITMGKFVDTNTIKTIWKLLDSLRPQPKVEWSEEDEEMRNALWNLLHLHYAQDNAQTLVGIEAGKFRSWLKSLRPQLKGDMYKEKNEAFKLGKQQLAIGFMNYLDDNRPKSKMISNGEYADIDKAFKENNWKKIMGYADKYLPYVPSWKPSEHQMSMLLAVVNDPNNAGSESCHLSLKSLYNDLKKL